MKLQDRVVFITDGVSRAGLAIARRLKAEGAILVLNVFPPEAGTEGGDLIVHANPASKKEVDAAVQAALAKYGRIDVVVHNNNEVVRAALEDCSDEVYDRVLDLNTRSAFLFAQAAGAAMKQARKGAFVFLSSIHGEKPNGAAFAYSIARGAVKMLAREMVLNLGPFNVRTNLVSMGPLEEEEGLFYSDLSPLYEHTRERILNETYPTLEEAANAVLFFAGDDCPSANGAELVLDGGFLLSYFSRRKNQFPPPQNPVPEVN